MTDLTVARVRSIGRAELKVEADAAHIVANAPADMGHADAVWHALGMTEVPRKERPAQRDADGERTPFGIGFDKLASAVRHARNVGKGDNPTDWLRLVEQAAKNATVNGHDFEEVMLAAKRGATVDETE